MHLLNIGATHLSVWMADMSWEGFANYFQGNIYRLLLRIKMLIKFILIFGLEAIKLFGHVAIKNNCLRNFTSQP